MAKKENQVMSMNKRLMMLVFLAFMLITPTIKVDANVQKTKTYSCRCVHNNGVLDCRNTNCTADIIERKLNEQCGQGGTLGTISFSCDGYSGSSPEDACRNKAANDWRGTGELHMGVKGSAVCTGGPTERIGDNFCSDTQQALRFLGFLLFFAKILVPFAIIFMGTLDYYKVIVAGSKDDEMKKQTITFIKRICAGIIIFFIPTFLNMAFTVINGWSDVADEYEICATCLLDPGSCD